MGGAKGNARRIAAVVMGAVAALSGYVFVVKPYMDKQSMNRLEQEARQIYLQRLKRLASERSEGPSSDSHGR